MKVNFLNFSDPKDHRYFLLTGNEFILKEDAVNAILHDLKNNGFKEKVSVTLFLKSDLNTNTPTFQEVNFIVMYCTNLIMIGKDYHQRCIFLDI